jgi:predicted RNA binding protein YcfA (HicA-like mRNA interferase family)
MAGDMRFFEVRKMLEKAGYELVRISGSHHYFVKPGEQPFSIPVHQGKVKPYYVREVKKVCQGP